jgi:hypothetical protein
MSIVAFNITRKTLHSLLKLPVKNSKSDLLLASIQAL